MLVAHICATSSAKSRFTPPRIWPSSPVQENSIAPYTPGSDISSSKFGIWLSFSLVVSSAAGRLGHGLDHLIERGLLALHHAGAVLDRDDGHLGPERDPALALPSVLVSEAAQQAALQFHVHRDVRAQVAHFGRLGLAQRALELFEVPLSGKHGGGDDPRQFQQFGCSGHGTPAKE